MAAAFRAAGAAAQSTDSLALPLPTRQAGDLLVATVVTFSSTTWTAPAAPTGWTLRTGRQNAGHTGFGSALYTRIATNTSADSFELTVGPVQTSGGRIAAYSGVNASDPILGSGYSDVYVNSGGAVGASLTVDRATLLVLSVAVRGNGAFYEFTGTTGMTKRYDNSGYQQLAAFDEYVGAGTHSESVTPSLSNPTGNGTIFMLALKEPNKAPNAPTLTSPAGGATLDRATAQRLSWQFSDADPGDSQSKYDLQYRVVGAGSWSSVTGVTPNQFHDFAGGTFAAGNYEWQVRTYDAQGLVGPYSASEFFTAANAPATPTVTAPINGSTIAASSALVQWSVPAQDAYQVRTVADSAGAPNTAVLYTDTGTAEDPVGRSRQVAFATNNRYEHAQVRVRSGGLWTPWASVRVQVSFTPPAAPTASVAADPALAGIVVTVTHPAPGTGEPAVASTDIHRRETATGGDGIRIALSVGGSFTDRTPASGVDYQYRAVANGTNGTSSTSSWTS